MVSNAILVSGQDPSAEHAIVKHAPIFNGSDVGASSNVPLTQFPKETREPKAELYAALRLPVSRRTDQTLPSSTDDLLRAVGNSFDGYLGASRKAERRDISPHHSVGKARPPRRATRQATGRRIPHRRAIADQCGAHGFSDLYFDRLGSEPAKREPHEVAFPCAAVIRQRDAELALLISHRKRNPEKPDRNAGKPGAALIDDATFHYSRQFLGASALGVAGTPRRRYVRQRRIACGGSQRGPDQQRSDDA